MAIRVGINGFGRIGRNILRAIYESKPQGHRSRRHQRSRAGRDQRPPVALRQRARPLPRRSDRQGRHDQPRQRRDQGHRRARPVEAALEGHGRRHRLRVHRHLHLQGSKASAHLDRRRQARAGLGAGRRRRPDGRLRRQPRQADQGPPDRLERLLHHQLPRPGRQGAERHRRHRDRLHDHDPRLHRRPADAGHHAQGSLPRPRRGAVDDPDLDRRGQGDRPGAAGAERQARRHRDPRADAERLGGRSEDRREEEDRREGNQRGDEARRGAGAEGHPWLHQRTRTSRSTSTTTPTPRPLRWTRPRCRAAIWCACCRGTTTSGASPTAWRTPPSR